MTENDHDWAQQNYVCFLVRVFLLERSIALRHSTTYFAVFLISIQIFTNVMETADRVHVTNCIV